MKGKRRHLLWDWMAFFYDQFYRRFFPYRNLHREIIAHFKNISPGSRYILDAGCGTGLLSLELARRGYPVVGVDRSTSMLGRAEGKKKKENLTNAFFWEGDLNGELDLSGYPLQRILFVHSLYLVAHPGETLRHLCSFLPPGGEVILCNPSRKLTFGELWAGGRSFVLEALHREGVLSIFSLMAIVWAMGLLNLLIQRRKKGIYHCWTQREMEALLQNCDLKVIWVKKGCLAESHLLLCAVKEH
jgi:SAM-dependent methyltransferase